MNEEELINSSPSINSSPGPVPKRTKASPPVIKDSNFVSTIWSNKPRKNYNSTLGSIAPKMASTYHGQNTGLGESTFDEGVLWGTDIDDSNVAESINENRYNQQGWGLQIGAGIARAGTKAATEILKLPGVVVGGVMAIGAAEGEGYDTAFNNQWIKSIDKINESINTEILPVYVGKAIKEGNLWDNITSTSFWGTDGADGLGYMIGMMAPGAIINKIGVGAKLVGGAAKLAKGLGMTESLEVGINGLAQAGFKGAQSVDMGLGVAANTIFEAGAEAKGVGDTLDAQKNIFVQNYPAQQLQKLQQLDVRRRNGKISIDEYNRLSEEIGNKTAEESFKEQRAIAMADNFKMNLAILLGPNLLMHQAIWGKAARKVESEALKLSTKARIGNAAKRWGQAFASEGFLEEGGQSTSEHLFTNKAMRGDLDRNNNFLGDFSVGELTNGYLDMVSSNEGQKAIFLGGVMGGPMMSYHGHKEDLNNQRESNAILTRTNESINSFNTIFNNDIYKKKEDGSFVYKKDILGNEDPTQKVYDPKRIQEIAIANHFTEERSKQFEQAVSEGNEDVVNEIKQQAIFDLILPSIYNRNGGLEVMQKQLQASQEFQEIIARDNLPNNSEKSSTFVDEILDAVKNLQFQQEKFDNFSKDVIDLQDSRSTQADRESYLNKLSAQYLQTKYNQYNAEKQVKLLEKYRNEILDELDINPQIQVEDLLNNQRLINETASKNPVLNRILNNLNINKNIITKSKKDVAELWSGRELINKSFKDYIDAQLAEEERLSDANVAKAQKVIDDIEQAQTKEDLDKIKKDAKKELIGETSIVENPLIQEKLNEKNTAIEIQDEVIQDDLTDTNESLARDKREEVELSQSTDTDLLDVFDWNAPLDTSQENDVSVDDVIDENIEEEESLNEEVPLEKPLTSIASEDIILDGNPLTTVYDEEPISGIEISQEIDKLLEKQQTGVKLISTFRKKNHSKNGTKLDFISQDFLDYERNGENKINTPVGFKLGTYAENEAGEALKILKSKKKKTKADLDILYNYLPLSIFIPTSENNIVESFIEGYPQFGASKQAIKIFTLETLPMRKLIVDALVKGINIKDISSHIVKQFPGVLKVDNQILLEDGRKLTPTNSIADLQFFSTLTGNNLLSEIAKRSYYVDYDGQLTSVNNKLDKKGDEHKGFGEVFLEIPQNNGKPFMLKLNYKALDVDKAGAVFEIFKVLSTLIPTIENPSIQSMTINEFLDMVDPEVRAEVIDGLGPEIKLVNDLYENNVDKTLDKLIDYVIYQNSTNKRTRFKMDKNGTLRLGDLSPISKITKDQLLSNDPYFKETVIDFLQKKRHNVLITKDQEATFQNPIYLQYILDNDILSTNAVVNEPTFQGYSNIYISNNLKGLDSEINADISSELEDTQVISTKTTDTYEGSITDLNNIFNDNNLNIENIEKRRREELEKNEAHWLIPLGVDLTLSENKEILKRKQLQDKINAKYDAELININNKPTKSEEDQVMDLLDKFEDWNLDISLIDTTQTPKDIISQISNIVKDNDTLTKEFKKICGL